MTSLLASETFGGDTYRIGTVPEIVGSPDINFVRTDSRNVSQATKRLRKEATVICRWSNPGSNAAPCASVRCAFAIRFSHWVTLALKSARESTSDTSSRSEEHTSEPQALMHISYAVFCFEQKQ